MTDAMKLMKKIEEILINNMSPQMVVHRKSGYGSIELPVIQDCLNDHLAVLRMLRDHYVLTDEELEACKDKIREVLQVKRVIDNDDNDVYWIVEGDDPFSFKVHRVVVNEKTLYKITLKNGTYNVRTAEDTAVELRVLPGVVRYDVPLYVFRQSTTGECGISWDAGIYKGSKYLYADSPCILDTRRS